MPAGHEPFVGRWADAAARVCRVLGFPALLPSEWADILTSLARGLGERRLTDLAALERTIAEATAESRAAVRFVGVGMRQPAYDLAGDLHTPRQIGECFTATSCDSPTTPNCKPDATDRAALLDWLLGGLPPPLPSATG